MFVEQIPVAEKILRTILIYALVAVLIRATGKRHRGDDPAVQRRAERDHR
jgi:hypothetical protein